MSVELTIVTTDLFVFSLLQLTNFAHQLVKRPMRLLTIAIAVVHCLASTAFKHLTPRHEFALLAYSLFLRRKEQRRPDFVAGVDFVDNIDNRSSVNFECNVGFSLYESTHAINMTFEDCYSSAL
jgi:hypothetical protein